MFWIGILQYAACFSHGEDVSQTGHVFLQVIGSRSLQMNPAVPMLQCAVRQSILIWPGSGLKSLLAWMIGEAFLFAG